MVGRHLVRMRRAERRVIAGQTGLCRFSLDSPDRALTWSEFDHAAANLAHRLLALGVGPGDGVAVWQKDTSAIHVLLVAIERCGNCRGASGRA